MVTKTAEKQLVKIQALLLDSLAPFTHILEAHHNGDTLDQKEVIQAVKLGMTFIGNVNTHLLHLQRQTVVGEMNKALFPIVRDDNNFKEAAPLLSGTEFAKKSKDMVERVKVMRSTITIKLEQRPPFFQDAPPPPPPNRGALTDNPGEAKPKISSKERGHTRWREARYKK